MPEISNDFPENCLRGVFSSKHIVKETGGVSFEVFIPNTKTSENREDRGEEVSINWEDDESVLEFTLNCRKENGYFLFPNGAVKLKHKYINRINTLPTMENPISCERREIKDNPYHGNIVYREGLTPKVKKMIAYYLAVHASSVISRNDISES